MAEVKDLAGQKQAVVRSVVGKFYHENREMSKSQVANFFKKLGIKERRTYYILANIEERGYMLRKTGSGRPKKIMTPAKEKKLEEMSNHQSGISQRVMGGKLGCTQQYVSYSLKKLGINYRKKQKVPLVTEKQAKKQRTRCAKLRKTVFKATTSKQCVMDDEFFRYLIDPARG